MKNIEINELAKQIYIKKFLELIENNRFQVIPRDKNEMFILKYDLNNSKIRNMLLCLEKDDIQYLAEDKEFLKYGNEPLIVFKKPYKLIDRYGNTKTCIVYIKIKNKENCLPIISFHLDE